MIPLAGSQPATDPRVIRTVYAIERELMSDGFVQRYRPKEHIDDAAAEVRFVACTFWLAGQ